MKKILIFAAAAALATGSLPAYPVVVFNPTNGVVLIPTNFVAANLAGVTVTNTFNGTATNLAGNALVQATNITKSLISITTSNSASVTFSGNGTSTNPLTATASGGGGVTNGQPNVSFGTISPRTGTATLNIGANEYGEYGLTLGNYNLLDLGESCIRINGGWFYVGPSRNVNSAINIGPPLYGETNPGIQIDGGFIWSSGSWNSQLREDGSISVAQGAFEVSNEGMVLAGTIPPQRLTGVTTNVQGTFNGATRTLMFTNGVLMRVTTP